jgi:competence protein ComEA
VLLALAAAARLSATDAAPAVAAFQRWRVDLNAAPAAEIEALPGVGPVLAARIVAERARGPFASPEDLARVPGVGPGTIERVREFARCGAR